MFIISYNVHIMNKQTKSEQHKMTNRVKARGFSISDKDMEIIKERAEELGSISDSAALRNILREFAAWKKVINQKHVVAVQGTDGVLRTDPSFR